MKMLWVDDNVADYTGLVAHIQNQGNIQLDTATSVEEALSKLRPDKYEMLLFDLALPQAKSQASLVRQSGILVYHSAVEKGVSQFIAFTVLTESEVEEELGESVTPGYQFVSKSDPLSNLLTAIESARNEVSKGGN